MKISVIGKISEITSNTTILGLLSANRIKPEQVGVELNEKIIERKKFKDTFFSSDDKIEILSFVGGG